MKTCKTILAALLIGASPAAWAQYSQGISDLSNTNISAALTDFTSAVASSPTNANANVYLALTRLLALPNQPAGSHFLTRLGFSAAGRNVYDWTSAPPESTRNGSHHLVVPPSLNADEFTAEFRTNILPALIACETNLAQITDTNFSLFLPESVTHFSSVTIDYGDVQMIRAILDAVTVFGYTLHSWNLDAQFGAVSNIIATDKSLQAVLAANPNFLKIATPADQPLAGAAFTNGINRYFAASQFIRNRGAGVRLFNMLTNDLQDEQNFRLFLSGLEGSMSAPFGGPGANAGAIPGAAFYGVLNSLTNATVSMANFFNGHFNPRSLFPAITNTSFIWDSFPDTTMGGVLTGLTQTNLGRIFVKNFNAQLNLPGAAFEVLCSPSDQTGNSMNGVVMGPSGGDLYGATSFGGATGNGSFFKVTPSGAFTVLHSFGMNYDRYGNSVDGSDPGSVVLGKDHNFYGTTLFGGTNGNNSGTIFRITPAGTLTTVYTFGDQDDRGSTGGNPLLLGQDGNLYGTTQIGGDNYAGILFQFIPPAAGSGSEGTFRLLYSLPSPGAGALVQGTDGNFYGVAQYGGYDGAGGIFQYIPGNGGQFNSLYSFPFFYDVNGYQITLGLNTLVQGANGVFYGTAQYGGNNIPNSSSGEGDGFIYCVDTNGNFTNLYSFDESGFDGYGPIGALVEASTGAFYGIASSGGGNGRGTIFKFTPGGAPVSRVWFGESLGKQQSGQNNYFGNSSAPVSMGLLASTGGFYGTAPDGGVHGNGTVFSFNDYNAASILVQPVSETNTVGASAALTVTAGGSVPITYTWHRVGGALPANALGLSSPTLSFTKLTAADAGSYFVVASNSHGSSTSAVVAVTIQKTPLALDIAGTGIGTFTGHNFVSGETNVPGIGALLNVGESYSITAKPDTRSFFVNWTGTAGTSNSPTLNFIMRSNTSLTANFITNRFLGMAGNYNGLFANTNGIITEETAGMIGGLTLKTNGFFSGTLHLDGSAPVISGTFSPEGYWSNLVPTVLDKNVKVELFVTNGSPRTITGWVIGTNLGGWTSEITLVATLPNSSNFARKFDMVIPPGPSSPVTNPPGYGYALLANVPATATVNMTGFLADGTAISQSMPIGEDNGITIYPSPFITAAKGMLFGRLSLSNSPSSPGPSGTLTWIKKAAVSGSFKAGFTNTQLEVQGSPWIPPQISMPPNSPLTVMGGGLTLPLGYAVDVSGTNLMQTFTTPNYKFGSVNTNNGQMTITFTNSHNVIVTGHGVLLQDFQLGAGYFVSPNNNPTNFGSFIWEP